MKSQLQQLHVGLGISFLLVACTPKPPQPGVAGSTAAQNCTEFLTVLPGGDDGHLLAGHELRIKGPNQDGDYRLRAWPSPGKPDHHLVIDMDHPVLEANRAGSRYRGIFDIKGGPHGTVRQHIYDIQMEFENGCPSKMTFDTVRHAGDDGNDHGGHAVAD